MYTRIPTTIIIAFLAIILILSGTVLAQATYIASHPAGDHFYQFCQSATSCY